MSKPRITKEVKEFVEWFSNVVLTERQNHFNNVISEARKGDEVNTTHVATQMRALTEVVELRLELMRLIADNPPVNNDHENDGC